MKCHFLFLSMLFYVGQLYSQVSTRQLKLENQIINPANESLRFYDSLINKHRYFTNAYFNRAKIKSQLGDNSGAISDLNKLISIDSSDYEAFFYRGFLKYENGNYKVNPLPDYDKALKLNPDYGLAYSYRGLFKMREGAVEEALKDCTIGINKSPDNSLCYYNRGEVRTHLQDYQGAISDFQEVVKLDPYFFPAWFIIIDWKVKVEDYNGAVEDYSSLLRLYPDKRLILLARGKIKLNAHDRNGACNDFDDAKKIMCGEENEELEKLIKKYCRK